MIDVVGGTPVVHLSKVVPADAASVFVKLEWFNPTGAYKDRMAGRFFQEYGSMRKRPRKPVPGPLRSKLSLDR